MIDKNIQPDYSIEDEKLRLHAALPLLAPAIATAIGATLGLTGTGLVLQKKIQNYFANNPGALDSIVSTFGTKPGDQPEVEELTKPTTTPIETWEGSYPDTETGIALALSKKDKDKPVITETEEPKPPEQKPPEDKGPDIASEIVATEVLKESEDKIKNKITTWEDHFPTIEEATKAAKDVGGTLKEFEEGLIEKKITFKRIGTSDYTVYYDGKEVAELAPLEEKYKGLKEYNIKFMGEIEASDTGTGLAESKALVKKYIVEGLLDKSEPSRTPGLYWEPLRKTFQEATFDKKGNYVRFSEPAHTEKELEELVERVSKKKLKKAYGGLIDRPLIGGSRYI